MKKIYLATTNKSKLGEIQEILKTPLEAVNIEIDEVQSMDLEYVARKKAEEAYSILQKPVFVDDVGVFIDAWNGFPGPFAKFLLESLGNPKILQLLKNEENRAVRVQSIVGYHDGREVRTFIGEVKGTISDEERGTEGWGFDPIIIPDGQNLTYAEMGRDKKNAMSHRKRAFDKFAEFLNSQSR